MRRGRRAKGFPLKGRFHEKASHETRCLIEKQGYPTKERISWKKGLVEKEGVEKKSHLVTLVSCREVAHSASLSSSSSPARVMHKVKLTVGFCTVTPRSKERGRQLEAAGCLLSTQVMTGDDSLDLWVAASSLSERIREIETV
jgi:hypothetical protein